MENKKIEIGNFVVLIGCENCNCHRLGFIFKACHIVPAISHHYTSFCPKAQRCICEESIAMDQPMYLMYPLSWLRTYPHFENWYGN